MSTEKASKRERALAGARAIRVAALRHPYRPALWAVLYNLALLVGVSVAGLLVYHAPHDVASQKSVHTYYVLHTADTWQAALAYVAALVFFYLFQRNLRRYLRYMRVTREYEHEQVGRTLAEAFGGFFTLVNAAGAWIIMLAYVFLRAGALGAIYWNLHKGGSLLAMHRENYLVNSGTFFINLGFAMMIGATAATLIIFAWSRWWNLVLAGFLMLASGLAILPFRGLGTGVYVLLTGLWLTVHLRHQRKHPEPVEPIATVRASRVR